MAAGVDDSELVAKHRAKVYGKAGLGAPRVSAT